MACECQYRGTGEVWGQKLLTDGTPDGAWFRMSQSSTFATTPTVEEVDYPDYDGLAGGTCDTEERISNVALAMTVHSYCPQTLAANMGGTLTTRAAAAVTDEPHKAYRGGFIPFAKLPDLTAPVVVTDAGATPIADTEYTRVDTGIVFNAGTTAIVDGADILIDYTSAQAKVIEAFKSTGNLYSIRLPAVNAVGKEGRWNILLRRVKFSVASEQGWKSTDAPSFALAGKLLKDPAVLSTDPESPYMTVETSEV